MKKDASSIAVVIEQGEQENAITMFTNPEVRYLIEEAKHIFD